MNNTSGPRAYAKEPVRRYRRPTLVCSGDDRSSDIPAGFLEQLRPSGRWVLTAIVPDGPTETITADSAREARHLLTRMTASATCTFPSIRRGPR